MILPKEAQFDFLVNLPDDIKAVIFLAIISVFIVSVYIYCI